MTLAARNRWGGLAQLLGLTTLRGRVLPRCRLMPLVTEPGGRRS